MSNQKQGRVPQAPNDHRANYPWKMPNNSINDMDMCEKQPDETNFAPSRGIDGDTTIKSYFTPLGGVQGPKADHDESRKGTIDPPAGT